MLCGQRVFYVSGTGSDANAGTAVSPFRQIQRAVDTAEPGDLILVGGGVYSGVNLQGFRGRSSAWLGIMSLDDTPLPLIFEPDGDVVAINGSSYIGIYGFEVAGTRVVLEPKRIRDQRLRQFPSHRGMEEHGARPPGRRGQLLRRRRPVGLRLTRHARHQLQHDLQHVLLLDRRRQAGSASTPRAILTHGGTWDGTLRKSGSLATTSTMSQNLVPVRTLAGISYITDGNADLDRLASLTRSRLCQTCPS